MRLRQNEGLKLNNIFTILTIGIMSVAMYLYFKYIKQSDAFMLCKQDSVYIENIYDEKILSDAYGMHKNGQYEIRGNLQKSIWMPSKFDQLIETNELDFELSQTFVKQIKSQKYVVISYDIIENDKLNPHKKESSVGKNDLADLIVTFKINGQTGYKITTKIKTNSKIEISKKLNCAMEGFYNAAK